MSRILTFHVIVVSMDGSIAGAQNPRPLTSAHLQNIHATLSALTYGIIVIGRIDSSGVPHILGETSAMLSNALMLYHLIEDE